MTNCAGIAKALTKVCKGKGGFCSRRQGGKHILCNGKVARQAAVFPMRLCHAILAGLRNELRKEGTVEYGVVGMLERATTLGVDVDIGIEAEEIYIADGIALRSTTARARSMTT